MDKAAARPRSYVHDDRAATAIEYSVIAAGIAVAIASVLMLVGASVEAMFVEVAGKL